MDRTTIALSLFAAVLFCVGCASRPTGFDKPIEFESTIFIDGSCTIDITFDGIVESKKSIIQYDYSAFTGWLSGNFAALHCGPDYDQSATLKSGYRVIVYFAEKLDNDSPGWKSQWFSTYPVYGVRRDTGDYFQTDYPINFDLSAATYDRTGNPKQLEELVRLDSSTELHYIATVEGYVTTDSRAYKHFDTFLRIWCSPSLVSSKGTIQINSRADSVRDGVYATISADMVLAPGSCV